VACLAALAGAIRAKLNPNPPDISTVMGKISELLDESITGATLPEHGPPTLDLSKINFEALAQRFKRSKHKNTDLEVLKTRIRAQLEKLLRLNRTRGNFAEKFEELIESYNSGSRNIEELFEELLNLSNSLTEEEERHVRENLTEEELAIFDILTRPAPKLSPEERAELKKVARALLGSLKRLLVLDWRQKPRARSQIKLAIENALDTGLPRAFTPDLYRKKCDIVFEHFYESYPQKNANIYTVAA
jgi:type I restriction enzyme R subunit